MKHAAPLLAALLLTSPAALHASDAAGKRADGRPNILLVMTDDQGHGDFSFHGNAHLQTPHIDKLGESSVRFDRFYVNSFCAPTRAALLTGRWPLRTGCHGVTHNREAMRPSEVTMAEALRDGGYRSACIGKWHNGEQYPFTPQGQGFDESFGFNNGHWNNYFDPVLLRGAQPEQTKGYITDVLTDEAMKFITTNKARPFFCYLSYNAPHSPYQVPDKYFDKFKAKGFHDALASFYGMCENLDDNVGRLLAHLESERLANNTIVLFLTDNGGTAGVKTYNAGMRGGKTSVHEGGSRVPLFVRWPAAGWQPREAYRVPHRSAPYAPRSLRCEVSRRATAGWHHAATPVGKRRKQRVAGAHLVHAQSHRRNEQVPRGRTHAALSPRPRNQRPRGRLPSEGQ